MLKLQKKKKVFNILRGKAEISEETGALPKDNECFKYVSNGGFSSASFIAFIADKTKINNLYCSTFRIGKKEIQLLNALHKGGRLDNALFVVFSLMQKSDDYNYYQLLDTICKNNGWAIKTLKNHSKVFLLDTDSGKFVIETSSNLNENPKIEQFSFEKDERLYDFYFKNIFEL